MTFAELKQKYNGIARDMRSLHEEIGDKQWTDEQRSKWDAMKSESDSIRSQIEREEELRANDQRFVEDQADEQRSQSKQEETGTPDTQESRAAAFNEFLRRGMQDMSAEQRELLRELRAQGTAPNEAGGYTVPKEFQAKIVEAMKDYGGIASVAQVITTDNGRTIEWPTADGTADEGELIGENQQAGEKDVEFGMGSLGAYKLTSKIIRISNELLQDSGIDIQSYLAGRIGSRIGRAEARYLVQGTGAAASGTSPGQPLGLANAVDQGAATASATAVTFQEVNELIHSIDPAYRRAAGFRLAFNDGTLKLLENMTDDNKRPLWMPSIIGGAPSTFLNLQYVIDSGIDSIGAGNKFILAGDFKQFIVRRVTYMTLKRLIERFADYDQTGFLAFHRFGCVLQDKAAIKALAGKPAAGGGDENP